MSSMLEHLENNEAILLMYLAGELPAQDRLEVEHMLAGDACLRAELQRLRELDDSLACRLLSAETAPARQEMAIRRTLREMRRYQLQLQARPVAAVASQPWWQRAPSWAYPMAAAAAVIFLLLGLWGLGAFENPSHQPRIVQQDAVEPDDSTDQIATDWVWSPTDPLERAVMEAREMSNSEDDDRLLLML